MRARLIEKICKIHKHLNPTLIMMILCLTTYFILYFITFYRVYRTWRPQRNRVVAVVERAWGTWAITTAQCRRALDERKARARRPIGCPRWCKKGEYCYTSYVIRTYIVFYFFCYNRFASVVNKSYLRSICFDFYG